MLALALESLDKARNRPDDVRIFADQGSNLDEIEYVRDTYLPTADIFEAKEHLPVVSGCWNILQSIRAGYQTGADLIFNIEEDVCVRPQYFSWAYEQMATGKYLAVCGRKDRFHYPVYGPLFTNPASCLRRDLVEQVIPHIKDEYFLNLRAYLDLHFGAWESQSDLDDGLVRRIVRRMCGECAYPETPQCSHIGFRFYNKVYQYMNSGTIEQRIQGLRVMLKRIKSTDRYARDFEAPYLG